VRRSEDPVHRRLRRLALLHLAFAGLGAILALFPLFHVAIGIGFITGAFSAGSPVVTSPLAGWLFVAFGAAAVVAVLVFSLVLAMAANYLGQASHRDFCMVVAGVTCAVFPVGTALGVYTIVTLSREEVRRVFREPGASGWPRPHGT
jgi:MFS family permease